MESVRRRALVALVVCVCTVACSNAGRGKKEGEDDALTPVRARLATMIGTVKVQLIEESEFVLAKSGMSLRVGDVIRTLPDGHCRIEFTSGEMILMPPDAIIKIESGGAGANSERAANQEAITVQKGQVTVEIDPTAASSIFRFRTRDAAGVLEADKQGVVKGQEPKLESDGGTADSGG